MNPLTDERRAWLTLKLTPELGNRSMLRLIERFGSPGAVLRADAKSLNEVGGLRRKAVDSLLQRRLTRPVEEEWEALEERGYRLLCLNDADYPSNLKAIADAPAMLYVDGSIEVRDLVAVAVVGSRAASPMGCAFTERLCMDLAKSGVTVVSGLAVGIDGAAHRGALKGEGRTIAVLGCGLDVDYPRENRKLRTDVPASGAVVSEFSLGTVPAPGHFPQRNRIISGLALGVVVVEAAHRSGSLITARLALEQGREVFAVPGMARHYRSVGPHRLLKQGAKLVENAEDVLEELRSMIRPSGEKTGSTCAPSLAPGRLEGLSGDEAAVLALLDPSPRHIDELTRAMEWPVARVMSVLSALELKGIVQQLPGMHFLIEQRT
ncbi:MAG: DNA-processing protein DprA [Syntrophobacteraceae bacterium]